MNGVPAASGEAVNPAAASADPMPPRPEAGPARVTPRRPDPSSHAIYRVQVGAYLEWKNAEDTSRRLTAAGFSPSFEWYNRYWRVVLTGIRADELEAITRRLEAAGFSQVLYRRER
jgi:cell division protein FtsN